MAPKVTPKAVGGSKIEGTAKAAAPPAAASGTKPTPAARPLSPSKPEQPEEEVFVTTHEHKLARVKDSSDEWWCDDECASCSRELEGLHIRWGCSQGCGYDLCRACVLHHRKKADTGAKGSAAASPKASRPDTAKPEPVAKQQQLPEDGFYVNTHQHKLTRVNNSRDEWWCDDECDNCSRELEGLSMRWSCSEGCGYDLCRACALHHMKQAAAGAKGAATPPVDKKLAPSGSQASAPSVPSSGSSRLAPSSSERTLRARTPVVGKQSPTSTQAAGAKASAGLPPKSTGMAPSSSERTLKATSPAAARTASTPAQANTGFQAKIRAEGSAAPSAGEKASRPALSGSERTLQAGSPASTTTQISTPAHFLAEAKHEMASTCTCGAAFDGEREAYCGRCGSRRKVAVFHCICGNAFGDNEKVCGVCGRSLQLPKEPPTRRCSKCDWAFDDGSAFCIKCGVRNKRPAAIMTPWGAVAATQQVKLNFALDQMGAVLTIAKDRETLLHQAEQENHEELHELRRECDSLRKECDHVWLQVKELRVELQSKGPKTVRSA